jgi:beta-mannanase
MLHSTLRRCASLYVLAGTLAACVVSTANAATDAAAFTLPFALAYAPKVSAGQSVTLSVDVRAAAAASNMVVDLEVHDSQGNKVAQDFFSGQDFSAQQTIPYSWTYTTPTNMAAGKYVLEVGVFTANWESLSFFTGSAATFSVQAAAPAATTPAASTSKTALLNYMTHLSGNGGAHILIGQHTNYWDSVPTDDITGLTQQTGKSPAIVGVEIEGAFSPEGVAGGTYNGVTLANAYLSQGHIVLVSDWPGSPLNGDAMWNQTNAPSTPMPAANFANITTPGTAEHAAFQTYLQQLASALKQINGPFLFRPYLEQNGNWFWWGSQDPSQFAAMWQMEHDYLVAQGLSNIIWVFAANTGVGNYSTYYPGSEYVDVVGLDAYPPSTADTQAWQQLGALRKPEIYAEAGATLVSESVQAGTDTLDNSALLSLVEQTFPQIVGVVIWCQSVALDSQNGAAAVMNDPQVITLNALPSGL